jgi:hypothetical protein
VSEKAILLLALHAYPFALMLTEDIHPALRLAASSVLLRAVLPDISPEVETKRLERYRIIWRVPSFNVSTHALPPRLFHPIAKPLALRA